MLAAQQIKFQPIWMSFAHPNPLLKPDCPKLFSRSDYDRFWEPHLPNLKNSYQPGILNLDPFLSWLKGWQEKPEQTDPKEAKRKETSKGVFLKSDCSTSFVLLITSERLHQPSPTSSHWKEHFLSFLLRYVGAHLGK